MGVQITSGPRTQHCSVCIGKSIGCHTVSPTTPKHIRKTCNIQRDDSEQNWAIFETKCFIICGFLCLFIAAISISCVVHASLSVPDWEDRSSSPQSSQPPSLPTHDMHIKSVRLSSYSSAQLKSCMMMQIDLTYLVQPHKKFIGQS